MTRIQKVGKLATPSQRIRAVPVSCTKHSGRFGWHGFRLEDYQDLPESDFGSPAMDHHLLVYHYKALDGEFIHECAGRKTITHLQSGQVSFIPAGADNHWRFGQGSPSALHILVHADCFNTILGNETSELRDEFQVSSPELQNIARRLQIELANDGETGVLFAESMMEMFCRSLFSQFGHTNSKAEQKLSNVALARDLMEAEYDRTIRLAELAMLCNLSQSQLLRSFKAQFGTSPHQYLLARRLREAKFRLLNNNFETIAHISADLGFADQSHFNRHFLRENGVTPHQFRLRI